MPVANRPLLDHALGALRAAGVAEIVVVADSSSGSRVRGALTNSRSRSAVHVIDAPRSGGEVAALDAARRMTGDAPLVVHRGDALAGDLLSHELPRFLAGQADAAVLFLEPGLRQEDPSRHLSAWARHSRPEPLGIELLSSPMLDALCTLNRTGGGKRRLAGPLAQAGGSGWEVEQRVLTHGWRLHESAESVLDGNRFALEDLSADWHPDSLVRTRLEGRVAIHPSSRVEDSLLRGPCVIGANATIRHAYVGPYTAIGPGCVIENAELEHSVILQDATIRDVGWRLEHSVVGARARVAREFRLPQAVHLCLGDDARISVS